LQNKNAIIRKFL